MADEILKRDGNFITVLGGVTDNAAQDITMLRVDPTTKRLLVSATGSGGTPSLPLNSVQFNDNGSFGGDANFIWNKTTNILTLGLENDFGTIQAPTAITSDTTGGSLQISAGNGLGVGWGGELDFQGGNGGTTGVGGTLNLYGGSGGVTSGLGGSIYLIAGSARGGDSDGGSITFQSGAKSGAGVNGNIFFSTAASEIDLQDNGITFVAPGGNGYFFDSAGAKQGILDFSLIASTDKTFTFPNVSGTLALTANYFVVDALPGTGSPNVNAPVSVNNEGQPMWAFTDGVGGILDVNIKVPAGATSISSIKVLYFQQSTGNVFMKFYTCKDPVSTLPSTTVFDQTDTDTAYTGAANDQKVGAFTVPTTAYNALGSVAANDLVGIRISRNGASASDTYNTSWCVVSVRFTFA